MVAGTRSSMTARGEVAATLLQLNNGYAERLARSANLSTREVRQNARDVRRGTSSASARAIGGGVATTRATRAGPPRSVLVGHPQPHPQPHPRQDPPHEQAQSLASLPPAGGGQQVHAADDADVFLAVPLAPSQTLKKRGRPPKDMPTEEEKKMRMDATKEARTRRRREAKDELSVESPMRPKTIKEADNVTFVPGKTSYDTRAHALADIKAAAERDRKALSFSKGPNGKGQKGSDVITSFCPVAECAFRITFRLCHGHWECKASTAHTCSTDPNYRARSNFHAYNASELAPVLIGALDQNANLKPKDAVAHVQPYVAKTVTNDFASKVLESTKLLAAEAMNINKLKSLAELTNKSEIGKLTIQTTNAAGMKKILINRMKQEHMLKEKDLPNDAKTTFTPPDLSHINDEGGEYLTGWTYIPGFAVKLWTAGLLEKTPSFSDGAHDEGIYGGTFLA